MIGKQAATIVTRHLRSVHFAASHEKKKAEMVDMMPVGMFKRDVLTGENPRLLMMIPLKVVRPETVSKGPRPYRIPDVTSVGNVDGNVEEEKDPRLRVHDRLKGLVAFPLLVDNSGLILSHPLHRIIFLLLGQEGSSHGRIGKKDKGHYGPCYGDSACED